MVDKIKCENSLFLVIELANEKFKKFLETQTDPKKRNFSYFLKRDVLVNPATGHEIVKQRVEHRELLPKEILDYFDSKLY